FVQYTEPGTELPIDDRFEAGGAGREAADADLDRELDMSLPQLGLSGRGTDCLESEDISAVRGLVSRAEEELLEVRNFGETTLKEVKQKLAEHGLQLGMRIPARR